MQVQGSSDPRSPSELWWILLSGRFQELKRGLPTSLRGTIQLCVPRTPLKPAQFRHLVLNGPASAAYEGLAEEPEVWIEVDEERLGASLRGQTDDEDAIAPLSAFRSSGRHELWREFFTALNSMGQPKSWLQIRGSK
jgi:hypothetical protein